MVKKLIPLILFLFLVTPCYAGNPETDGSSSYVDTNYSPQIGSSEDFSWVAWVYKDTDLGASTEQGLFGYIGAGNVLVHVTWHFTGNNIEWGVLDDSADFDGVTSSVDLSTDAWTCMAGTFDHSNSIHIYVGGTKTSNNSISGTDTINLGGDMFIGGRNSASGLGIPSNIIISDIAFFEGSFLSDAQVNNYCNSRIKRNFLQIPGCTVGYSFAEGSEGSSADGTTYANLCNPGTSNAVGVADGGTITNNAETVLSY